jgi:hypothetical protein
VLLPLDDCVVDTADTGGPGAGWCISLMDSDTVEPCRTCRRSSCAMHRHLHKEMPNMMS